MAEELKQTCLHDRHVALGAQMSPFAGFDMPIQYKDITTEHNAVRNHVGVFDVSHMGETRITGKDAEKFVNHIFSNDVWDAPKGKVFYGMMLYEDGGTVDDLLVYKMGENDFFLVYNAANIDKDVAWIDQQSNGFDVKIDHQSNQYGQLAVQGPEGEKTMKEVLGIDGSDLTFYTNKVVECNGETMIVSRTGYTGEDGFEIYASPQVIVKLWDKLMEAGVQPCGLGCRDTLRFEAGLPLYGDELSPEISPITATLGMFAKLDKKGGFIGRDACAKQKAEGSPKKLVGLEIHGKAIPRHGYTVLDGDTEVGYITTGYHSITLDKSLAFALVNRKVGALGNELSVKIRKKVFPATIIKKRFYQSNYKK